MRCPNCGEEVQEGVMVCPHCSEMLPITDDTYDANSADSYNNNYSTYNSDNSYNSYNNYNSDSSYNSYDNYNANGSYNNYDNYNANSSYDSYDSYNTNNPYNSYDNYNTNNPYNNYDSGTYASTPYVNTNNNRNRKTPKNLKLVVLIILAAVALFVIIYSANNKDGKYKYEDKHVRIILKVDGNVFTMKYYLANGVILSQPNYQKVWELQGEVKFVGSSVKLSVYGQPFLKGKYNRSKGTITFDFSDEDPSPFYGIDQTLKLKKKLFS